jgi:hypothetical protein
VECKNVLNLILARTWDTPVAEIGKQLFYNISAFGLSHVFARITVYSIRVYKAHTIL